MKQIYCTFVLYILLPFSICSAQSRNSHYITNQAPLTIQPYTQLPLGDIKAEGMLKTMLELQRDGLTGNLDSVYSIVCGENNGWLGGTGDGWERGPYWLDGLVPLAYILDDKVLKQKAKKWIEWSLNNQEENGYFGTKPLPEGFKKIPGTQQDKRKDYWPKMVMLKVLQQYYMATGDERVVTLMTNYFHFLLKELPEKTLKYYTWWAEQRGGDNLQLVYWLYNITEDKSLLELANIIYSQTAPWAEMFSNGTLAKLNPLPNVHCVNLAMGVKTPVVYYQYKKDSMLVSSVKQGLADVKHVHGFACGMYGGDESMHGNDPTQGSELCSAVELMFSLEGNLAITGDMYYADYLEKIAYNVLPTQHDDEFKTKQYFQQANQIKITYHERNFFNSDDGRLVYGLQTGYPCCLTNMHQGWPKFVQNLWFATNDNGIAALVYGSSSVKVKVAGGTEVEFTETTDYPFKNTIEFTYKTKKSVAFPFHFRIPGWCRNPIAKINGNNVDVDLQTGSVAIINRTWKKGDNLILKFPMEIRTSGWAENAVAIERGPLLYALKIKEEWQQKTVKRFKDPFYEVYPKSDWNYGIYRPDFDKKNFEITEVDEITDMPWNLENAPITLHINGKQIEQWKEYNHSAGKSPRSTYRVPKEKPLVKLELIPYGCTTLRISQFPLVKDGIIYKSDFLE